VTPQPPTISGRFGAIILAGGASSRMGSAKALLDLDGQPLISRLIQTIRQVDSISGIILVTGHEANRIREALQPNHDVSFIHNPNHRTGEMLSSVKAGVNAVRDSWDGFFLMLLDQPAIKSTTLAIMGQAWPDSRPAVVIPAYQTKNGHPLLIASRCVGSIVSVPGDATLRDFVVQHQSQTQIVEVDDPGILTDVDTPAEYQRVLELWKSQKPHAPGPTNATGSK
jgi:CTP:molybdopterin cytidylyltransferase MocA